MEIPQLLKSRPRWGNYPIPFTILIDGKGVPDFKVSDQDKWRVAVSQRLCGLCGKRLFKIIFFIGGEGSCNSHFFLDPPMHRECAEYAMAVCPFIVGSKDYADREKILEEHPGTTFLTEDQILPRRMGLYETTDFFVAMSPTQGWALLADPPISVTYQERIR